MTAQSPWFRIGLKIIPPYFGRRYRIKSQGDVPSPPFLLVANHVSAVDPFFIATRLRLPVSWVVARISFQHPLERFFLQRTGAILKSKSRPDYSALKSLFRVLENGGVVGLFPEGTITWTGEFQEHLLRDGVHRLLTKISCPIVAARIQGAWLSQPVWARKPRKGSVFIDFQVVEPGEAIDWIRHSEWAWQREWRISYPGTQKALGIERVLWICPNCERFRTILGVGDEVVCRRCRVSYPVDDYGFLGGKSLPELLTVQRTVFPDFLRKIPQIVLPKVRVSLRKVPGTGPVVTVHGDLVITERGLQLGSYFWDHAAIRGLNTHFREITEFMVRDNVVQVETLNDAYLLETMVRLYSA